MPNAKGDSLQPNMWYYVGSSGADLERTERSSNVTALSSMSCPVITPCRIVRTVKMSPAIVQLVQLDAIDHRPLSDVTSVTTSTEEAVDDLVSESISVIRTPKDVLPALEFGAGSGAVSGGKLVSFDVKSEKNSTAHAQLRGGYSCFSLSSSSRPSVASSASQEYTEVFDTESVATCGWACVGDGGESITSLCRHANQSTAFNHRSQNIALVVDSLQKAQEGTMMRFSQRHGSLSMTEGLRTKKMVNVCLEERIGRGCFGDVFRGVDLDTGLQIAVKEILVAADHGKDVERQLRAMEREIRVMRKLNHKHIVSYYSARRDEGRSALLIYMEYVGGGTVGEKLRANGPFKEEEAQNFTLQLLEGLDYLHRQHIVHRDLKGDNLFLTEDGLLKVGDFGTSKELHTTLVTDSVAGTPNFMAPEVIACSGHSCMADIWSVGCCVLEMLTGHPPFWKLDNHMAVMFAVMKGKLEEQVPSHISEDAKDFIRLCTQNDPKDRPTAKQLQQHHWLGGVHVDAASENKEHSRLSFSLPSVRECVTKASVLHPKTSVSSDMFQSSIKAVVAVFPKAPPNVLGARKSMDLKVKDSDTSEGVKLFTGEATADVSRSAKRIEGQSGSLSGVLPSCPRRPDGGKLRTHVNNAPRELLIKRGGGGVSSRRDCPGSCAGRNGTGKSLCGTPFARGSGRGRARPARMGSRTLSRMEATACFLR